MAVADARRIAAAVLGEVERGRWSDAVLAKALGDSRASAQDKALATAIVYGVLAWRGSLDHTIERYSSRPIAKLDAAVLLALRIGLFQLFHLGGVPAYAAVATSVELVAGEARSAKGFVNALLRRAAREGPAPPPASPWSRRVAVALSHPPWLAEMWRDELGEAEAEALMAADNLAAPTCYRALVDREEALASLASRGAAARPGAYGRRALVVEGPVRSEPGLLAVQGEASQLVVELLDPRPGQRVLDACAAPGGKTAYIASLVGAGGRVVACDPGRGSRRRIEDTLARCAIEPGERVRVEETEVAALAEPDASFDAVLVDAPCSGLGTLRQHPEIRWRRSRTDLEELTSRQATILRAAARFVRPGGTLVYSTCTLAQIENESVVAAFEREHGDFRCEDAMDVSPHLRPLVGADGAMRTFPHRHGLDGFFAVRLRRVAPGS